MTTNLTTEKNIALSELAARFGGKTAGGDPRIGAVASLRSAAAGCLAFYVDDAPPAALQNTKAAAVLLSEQSAGLTEIPKWVVAEPKLIFARVAAMLNPPPPDIAGISPAAFVSPTATIGEGTAVAAGAVVNDGATIGKNCRIHSGAVVGANAVVGDETILHPRVVLYAGSRIGMRCTLHAGAVVGADGFGYVTGEIGANEKMPHLAAAVLGNDVEVGANSAIDRGTLDDTVIGNGVKIDNLVQIGHNVRIGDFTVICGNAGIAGSATIGKGCVIAGGAGVAGVAIGDGARVGGHSAVTRDIPPGEDVLSVWPAMPARQWRRLLAKFRKTTK